MSDVAYRSLDVDGLPVFYREAGPADAPTLLLLYGFPSSARMYKPTLQRLGSSYHLTAPDYIGFGHSAAPSPTRFSYTFNRLAEVVGRFATLLVLRRYSLFLQDYGDPDEFAFLNRPGVGDSRVELSSATAQTSRAIPSGRNGCNVISRDCSCCADDTTPRFWLPR